MSITVLIPSPLRPFACQRAAIVVEAATVNDALQSLAREYPGLRNSMLAESGELRPHVNVFVNAVDIRALKRTETRLSPGDTIHILPSIAGG